MVKPEVAGTLRADANVRTDVLTKPEAVSIAYSGVMINGGNGYGASLEIPNYVTTMEDGLNSNPYGNTPVIAPLAATSKAKPVSTAKVSPKVVTTTNYILAGPLSSTAPSRGYPYGVQTLDPANRQDSSTPSPQLAQNAGQTIMSTLLASDIVQAKPVDASSIVTPTAVPPGNTTSGVSTGASTQNTQRASFLNFSGNNIFMWLIVAAVLYFIFKGGAE